MLHPNQEKKPHHHHKKHYKGCAKYLHRFDEMIMKPIFIYRYEKNMQKKSKQFFELMMKQGDQIENEFKQEQSTRNKFENGLQLAQFNDKVSMN